jgi:hypothetical protein
MMGPMSEAAPPEPMADEASKLEAVKGMLMKLVAMLGGDSAGESMPESGAPGEFIPGETQAVEGSGEAMAPAGPEAAGDPKAKMLALLKAKGVAPQPV